MTDPLTQLGIGLMTLLGSALAVWGSIKVGRNADRAKVESDKDTYELGLIDRYRAALTETEERLNRRINGLEAEMRSLRAAQERAEDERDAAVQHAQELRDTWPGPLAVPPPPPLIADLFRNVDPPHSR